MTFQEYSSGGGGGGGGGGANRGFTVCKKRETMEKWIISTNRAEEQGSVHSLGVPMQEITFQSPEIEKRVDINMHLM